MDVESTHKEGPAAPDEFVHLNCPIRQGRPVESAIGGRCGRVGLANRVVGLVPGKWATKKGHRVVYDLMIRHMTMSSVKGHFVLQAEASSTVSETASTPVDLAS